MLSRLAILLILIFGASTYGMATPLIFEEGEVRIPLGLQLEYLEDPSGKLTLKNVRELELSGNLCKVIPAAQISVLLILLTGYILNFPTLPRIPAISHWNMIQFMTCWNYTLSPAMASKLCSKKIFINW